MLDQKLANVLRLSDHELKQALRGLDQDEVVARRIAIAALKLTRSERYSLAAQIETQRSDNEFTCVDCGKHVSNEEKATRFDQEAHNGMCWECWQLIMT